MRRRPEMSLARRGSRFSLEERQLVAFIRRQARSSHGLAPPSVASPAELRSCIPASRPPNHRPSIWRVIIDVRDHHPDGALTQFGRGQLTRGIGFVLARSVSARDSSCVSSRLICRSDQSPVR